MTFHLPLISGVLFCFVAAVSADAQEATPYEARFALRAGFAFGSDFSVGNTRRHVEGFQLGGDIPLIKRIRNIGGLTFSPTIVFGGSNRTGNDTDAMLYRFSLMLRRALGNRGLYGGIGAGYNVVDSRQNQFADTDGFGAQFLLGYLFPKSESARVQPFVEAGYQTGGSKLSGWTFEAGIRF